MNIELLLRPGSAAAKVTLSAGEHFSAEGGSMISMSKEVTITTTTHKKGKGGIMKALKRALSGESFFLNHYTSPIDNGEVILAPALPGDMMTYDLNDESLIVQAGSYVASEDGVEVDFGWQGFKSFLSGESAFWLDLNGSGKVIINSFGEIYPVEVDGEYIVDTGHIVAFNSGLEFSITTIGGNLISSFLGGEGLVCKFRGNGTVWCQSHNSNSFGQALGPKLTPRA